MKKLFTLVMIAMMFGFAANVAAYDGDFEISGHVNTGFGYQYNGTKWSTVGLGAFTEEGMVGWRTGGQTITATTANKNDANSLALFYVGDVELDITKTFGENIRLRADLDFVRQNSAGYGSQDVTTGGSFEADRIIEQAYATVNIPVGYGLEFLVGRFNAPIGFEAYDNNDNDLPFHTLIFNYLRPQNLTGIKFYYPFSDLVDLHFWVANNLRDVTYNVAGAVAPNYGRIPAFGGRLGFTWGMEGQESTIGVSGGAGPEARATFAAVGADKWGMWTYFGDLDFNIWVNDVFAIGGEGFYRRDGAPTSAKTPTGLRNNLYFAGLLNLHYLFSDVWDGTLRYTYANDYRGSPTIFGVATGYKGGATLNGQPAASQLHRFPGAVATMTSSLLWDAMFNQIDLGVNYHITDGAKIMMMYRFDLVKPKKLNIPLVTAAVNTAIAKMGMAHTVAANFAYEF